MTIASTKDLGIETHGHVTLLEIRRPPLNFFDLDLIRLVRAAVDIPVIASGGAGAAEHFPPAVEAGADAVLAASVFHFGTLRVRDVKASLAEAGLPVR